MNFGQLLVAVVLVCWSAMALAADLATDVPDPKADDFYRTLLMKSSDQEVVDQINQHYGSYQALAKSIGFVWRIQGHMCGRFQRAGYFSHAKACYEAKIEAAAAAPSTHAAYWEILKKGGGTNIAGRWTSDAVYRTNVQQLAASGHMGMAVVNLDFGDYAAVVREAELARALLRQSAYASDTMIGFPGVGIFAVGYSAAATASAQQGKLASAREYAALCRNLTLHGDAPFGRDTSNDRKSQNTACASAAVAAQEPAVAMEWINKSTSDALSLFMRASMAITTLGFSEVTSLGKQFTDPWDASVIFLKARLCEQANDDACAVRFYDLLLSDPERRTLTQYGEPPLLKLRPNLHYRVLYQRALLALQQGEAERGMQMLAQAIDVIESMRTNIDSETARIGFAGDKQSVYAALIAQLMKTGRHEQAFAYAERAKARALVDLLAQKMNFKGNTSNGASIAALLETQARHELHAPVLEKVGQEGQVRGLTRLPEIHEAIAAVAPELASLVAVESIDVKQLQRQLSPGETLVEYYGDESALFAFVLTAQGVSGYQLDGRGLNQLVASFRTELATPRSAAWREAGEALYQRLIAPIRPALQGAQLTIVPHGPLHYLPFAALPTGNAALLDAYAIRMLPSASVLKFLKQSTTTRSGDLLALGNPDLNDPASDLPGAQLEVEKITAGRTNSRLLVRQAATETAMRELGGGFRNVHLASHGVFNPERPLDSALMLAPDARNDGRLTVSEMYELELHAELVTLSACETALSKIASGDELVGFTRGFLYAGASSIVSSLWKVDDEATMLLMDTFYRQLLQGVDKRSALRSAQQALMRTGKAHPFYWAAFQLTGSVN